MYVIFYISRCTTQHIVSSSANPNRFRVKGFRVQGLVAFQVFLVIHEVLFRQNLYKKYVA